MTALISADINRCQTEKYTWAPFQFGRSVSASRCAGMSAFIAEEVSPGEDGQCGRMSVCAECASHLIGAAAGRRCFLQPVAR